MADGQKQRQGLADRAEALLGTDRKRRLYGAACWRHLWRDPEDVALAAAAESHADGLAEWPGTPPWWLKQADALAVARDASHCVATAGHAAVGEEILSCLAGRPGGIATGDHLKVDFDLAWRTMHTGGFTVRVEGDKIWAMSMWPGGGEFVVTDGRAFRPSWRTADVLSLARAAYDHQSPPCRRCHGGGWRGHRCGGCEGPAGTLDPFRLYLLADALEEAGCPQGHPLLGHLRHGSHWRGCRAVDGVLGLA